MALVTIVNHGTIEVLQTKKQIKKLLNMDSDFISLTEKEAVFSEKVEFDINRDFIIMIE